METVVKSHSFMYGGAIYLFGSKVLLGTIIDSFCLNVRSKKAATGRPRSAIAYALPANRRSSHGCHATFAANLESHLISEVQNG
eukprot:1099485-Amphidinium_carterae.1